MILFFIACARKPRLNAHDDGPSGDSDIKLKPESLSISLV